MPSRIKEKKFSEKKIFYEENYCQTGLKLFLQLIFHIQSLSCIRNCKTMSENQQKQTPQKLKMLKSLDPENKKIDDYCV